VVARLRPRHDVAIYAPFAGPLYAEPPLPAPGGAEVQMRYLATSLASLGLRVAHIVFDAPWLPSSRDGVDLIPSERLGPEHGRVAQTRELISALRAADAEAFVYRSAGSSAGTVAGYARTHGRKFILSTSWDGDLTLETPMGGRLARAAYRVGRGLADAIVVQTEDQLERGKTVTRRPLRLIRSFAEPAPASGRKRTAFLWVARVIDYKDPLAYVELARRVPEARFTMIADRSGPAPQELLVRLKEGAATVENLELLDPVPRSRLFELYEEAVAVVNTSWGEGFPNTFLEGWARGAPALTLHLDPDGVIRRDRLGAVADGSIEKLATSAKELWTTRDDPALSERARAYVAAHHSPPVIAGKWAELIETLRR
jgi:glycosyltransferase involved in cell wall biosynthesis